MQPKCRFCQIVAGDPDEYVIFNGDDTTAFLDIEPVNPGHSLVVPRQHWGSLTDMQASAVASLYRTVFHVANALEVVVEPDGINVIHSSGGAAGQDIQHTHVHVLPRYEDDHFGFNPPRREYEDGQAEHITEELQALLAA